MTDTADTMTDRHSLTGEVAARSGDKTISVTIDRLAKHRVYGKFLRRTTKLAVHDPKNDAEVGDIVEITKCRRISKRKSWRLVRVVRRGVGPLATVTEEGEVT